MGDRERRGAPPYGGTFVARATVMDADQTRRAVKRMAHEILERNGGLSDVVIVGLQTGGQVHSHSLEFELYWQEQLAPPESHSPLPFADVVWDC